MRVFNPCINRPKERANLTDSQMRHRELGTDGESRQKARIPFLFSSSPFLQQQSRTCTVVHNGRLTETPVKNLSLNSGCFLHHHHLFHLYSIHSTSEASRPTSAPGKPNVLTVIQKLLSRKSPEIDIHMKRKVFPLLRCSWRTVPFFRSSMPSYDQLSFEQDFI